MILLRYLNRLNVIVGSTPAASYLARQFAEKQQAITIIKNAPFGEQHSLKKTATLSVEAEESHFQMSCEFMASLKRLNQIASAPFLTARPGMVYLAMSGSDLSKRLQVRSKTVSELTCLTQTEVSKILPNLSWKNLEQVEAWFNPESYQVNTEKLVTANLNVAEKLGAEIITGEATPTIKKDQQSIWTDTHYRVNAENVFLMSGVRNNLYLQKLGYANNQTTTPITCFQIQSQQRQAQSKRLVVSMTSENTDLFSDMQNADQFFQSINMLQKQKMPGENLSDSVSGITYVFVNQETQRFSENMFQLFKNKNTQAMDRGMNPISTPMPRI